MRARVHHVEFEGIFTNIVYSFLEWDMEERQLGLFHVPFLASET